MRISVLVVMIAGLAACKFDTSSNHVDDPSLRPPQGEQPAAGDRTGQDAAGIAAGGSGAGGAAGTAAMDAATAMDGSVVMDAAVPDRTDAEIDASQFGDNPTPDDPDAATQTGGLKCADTFCPFATAPVQPCCTAAADVESGAARELDRCGLNFSELGSDFYGAQCWQRDQPGVVDDSCPAVQVDVHSADPGCCTDTGECGGVDSEHGLGCHVDPGGEQQSCGSVSPGPDAGTGNSCELGGQYALVLDVDMAWGGRSGGLWALTDDGRGILRIQMLATFDHVDPDTLELSGTIKPCGVQLPTFYSSTLCEAYEPIFPTRLWESDKMPSFPLDGHAQCAQPGCIATVDAQTVLLGIELNNPESPWPTADDTAGITCPSGKGAQCFPDHDGDGRPGLSVEIAKTGMGAATSACRNGYDKQGAPLSSSVAAIFDGVRRSDRVLLGVRMKVGATFTLGESCGDGDGSGIAEFVNSRAWGCLVQQGTYNFPWGRPAGANEACTSSEASFMDANLPLYRVLAVGEKPPSTLSLADTSASKGPQVHVVRLGDAGASVTCADVRNAPMP